MTGMSAKESLGFPKEVNSVTVPPASWAFTDYLVPGKDFLMWTGFVDGRKIARLVAAVCFVSFLGACTSFTHTPLFGDKTGGGVVKRDGNGIPILTKKEISLLE